MKNINTYLTLISVGSLFMFHTSFAAKKILGINKFIHNKQSYALLDSVLERQKQNIFYVEFFGNGGTFSLNYERVFFKYISLRAGFGTLFSGLVPYKNRQAENAEGDFIFMLNYIINICDNNYLTTGAGVITAFKNYFSTFSFGYCYSPENGGVFFKITFDTLPYGSNNFNPWGGIGIGVRF